jgi:hypothetical protein
MTRYHPFQYKAIVALPFFSLKKQEKEKPRRDFSPQSFSTILKACQVPILDYLITTDCFSTIVFAADDPP